MAKVDLYQSEGSAHKSKDTCLVNIGNIAINNYDFFIQMISSSGSSRFIIKTKLKKKKGHKDSG